MPEVAVRCLSFRYWHITCLTPPAGNPCTARQRLPNSARNEKAGIVAGLASVTGGKAALGVNAVKEDLPRVRADSTGQILTTNQGVPIADNQHSLTAGLRGPALRKDFILREKLTHFDHERIPERVVHARGSAAHGYFECYEALTDLTCASLFSEAGKRTPCVSDPRSINRSFSTLFVPTHAHPRSLRPA